jgi:hypothetical protein
LYRVFDSAFGQTPGEYRKLHRMAGTEIADG